MVELVNGSVFELRGADDPDTLLGPGLDRLGIDESQDIRQLVFEKTLRPMLIGRSGRAMLIGTKRPHNWFRDQWVAAHGRKVEDSAAFYFPSTANPTVDSQEWAREKKAINPWIWEREYISDPLSKEESKEGLMFSDFDRRIHMVSPFKFDHNFKHYRGMDWGIEHPTACLWGAVDQRDGTVYIYDEYCQTGGNAQMQCYNILAKSRIPITASVLDVACWHRESDNLSIADRFKQYGIPCFKAKKENKSHSGINCVKTYLKPLAGPPKVKIFSNLVLLPKELETVTWKIREINNDLSDCLRYLLVFVNLIPLDSKPFHVVDNDSEYFLDSDGKWQYRLSKNSKENNLVFNDVGYLT